MARKIPELQPGVQQLELTGFTGARKRYRRVAAGVPMRAPVGDEELDQKDLRADGAHLNFGGMSESKLRNWRNNT